MIALVLATLLAAPRAPRAAPADQPAPAPQAFTDEEIRHEVNAYLNVIDRPIPAARWKELGPRAAPLLEAVIADEKEFPSRRAMAVDGLTAAAPDRAKLVLGNVARDTAQPGVVRVAAMHGAAEVLAPADAARELRPVLRSARTPGLRAAAADALSRKSTACAEVRDQAARETPEHRPAFDRALKRCAE